MPHDLTQRLFRADRALFIGRLPAPERHAHPVLQCAVGLEAPLEVALPGAPGLRADAVLIASDAEHAVAGRGVVGHFYLAPTSPEGARLGSWLGSAPARRLPQAYAQAAAGILRRAWRSADPDALERALDELVAALMAQVGPPAGERCARDARVERALERLSRQPNHAQSLAEVARLLGVSPDRLRHVFRDQVGTPFRRYRRWLRLMRGVAALRVGASVTEAALAGGFADAAHFSRTFRAAFTVSPSAWRAGSRFLEPVDVEPGSRFVQAGEVPPA